MADEEFNRDLDRYLKEKNSRLQLNLSNFFKGKKAEGDIPQEKIDELIAKKQSVAEANPVEDFPKQELKQKFFPLPKPKYIAEEKDKEPEEVKTLVHKEYEEIKRIEKDIEWLKTVIAKQERSSLAKQIREQQLQEKEQRLERLLHDKDRQLDEERLKFVHEKEERVHDIEKGYKKRLKLVHTKEVLKDKVRSLNDAIKGMIRKHSTSDEARLIESMKRIIRIQEGILEKTPSSIIAQFTKSNDYPLYLKLIESCKEHLISTRFLERIKQREEHFKHVSNVQTSVDGFVDLIRKKKKISISEAAQALGVSPEVIEEWADLLEKDGVIRAQYTFTNEYFVEQ